MSTEASEKNRELLQGLIVYRQRVLQTVTSLGIVSLVFGGHDLLRKKKPDFWYGKNKFPERTAEMESRSRSKLKGAWPNVRKESK